MRARKLLLAVIAALLLLCAVGWTGYAQRGRAKRTEWEYKAYLFGNPYVDDRALKEINELGAEGWELVGVSELLGEGRYGFFKRPKQPAR
jgi:hypothetical protein